MGIIHTQIKLDVRVVLVKYKTLTRVVGPALSGGLLLLTLSIPYLAIAESSLVPTLELEESFLTNKTATLDESGQITRISPGLQYLATGARSSLSINYAINALYYNGLDQDDETDQALQLNADIDHITERWNSYFTSTIQQTNVSQNGIQILNPNIQSANTSELRTSRIGTALTGRWGDAVNYDTNINADYADFEDSEDTKGIGAYFALSSPKTQSKLSWNTSVATRIISTFENDEQIDTFSAGLDYRLSRRYAVFLALNKSNTDADGDFLNETSKTLGVQWTPDRNNSLRLGVGERGEQTTYSLDALTKTRHTTFTANYAETVTTTRALLIEQAATQEEFTPTGLPLSITPVLIKNGRVAMTTTGIRSSLTLAYFKQTTDRSEGAGDDETTDGLSLDFSRTLSGYSAVGVGVSRRESDNVGQENTIDDASISYNRQVSRQSDLIVALRTTEQTSDVVENEYKQDLLSISFNMDF